MNKVFNKYTKDLKLLIEYEKEHVYAMLLLNYRIREMLLEVHSIEKSDFLKPIIHSQIILFCLVSILNISHQKITLKFSIIFSQEIHKFC